MSNCQQHAMQRKTVALALLMLLQSETTTITTTTRATMMAALRYVSLRVRSFIVCTLFFFPFFVSLLSFFSFLPCSFTFFSYPLVHILFALVFSFLFFLTCFHALVVFLIPFSMSVFSFFLLWAFALMTFVVTSRRKRVQRYRGEEEKLNDGEMRTAKERDFTLFSLLHLSGYPCIISRSVVSAYARSKKDSKPVIETKERE